MKRTIITSLLVLCCMDEVVRAQQKDVASYLRSEHREVVQQWLTNSKLTLRVATLADNSNKEGLAIRAKKAAKAIILTTSSEILTATENRISLSL